MPYTVQLAPAAQRQLQSLPKQLHRQITKRLLKLEVTSRPEEVKMLEGEKGLYRPRIGGYRIIYAIRDRELIVLSSQSAIDGRSLDRMLHNMLSRKFARGEPFDGIRANALSTKFAGRYTSGSRE